jgi:hypothetical protein
MTRGTPTVPTRARCTPPSAITTALRGEGLVHTGHAGDLNSKEVQGCGANTAMRYDAFGDNRTSFRELERKTPIFYGREVQKISNASY